MISVTMAPGGAPLIFNATVNGLAIYLDNFSLIDLAKHNPERRKRLIGAFHSGTVDLLFSVTNAAELSGPQGQSLELVRAFLDEIGPNWFPVELDPEEVVKREMKGAKPAESCLSQQFMKDYFAECTRSYAAGSGRIIDLSSDFFRLGPVLDWVCPQRDSIRKGAADMDTMLIETIRQERIEFKRNPSWLNKKYPVAFPFNSSMPATFTYLNLRRDLVLDRQHQLKRNDGFDYCHAVLASAFSSLATLDKQWKRRIENLPKPNKLAKIY
jgi:hypothetical protein